METYPLHVRRKQFFEARQRKSNLFWNSLIDEADDINILVNDLICMMLQIGISDQGLQRELGSIREPTLQAFNEKIEDYEQARKTTGSSAFSNAATQGNAQRRPANQGKRSVNTNVTRGRGERGRRIALRGKCVRCARNDYIIPNCSYPESVKSNTCGASGHITPACERRQNAQLAQHVQLTSASSPGLPAQPSAQLAIAYDGGSHFTSDGASAWPLPSSASSSVSTATRAGAFYAPTNRHTPKMLL